VTGNRAKRDGHHTAQRSPALSSSHDEAIAASNTWRETMTKTKKIFTGTLAAVALAVVSLSAGSTAAEAKHKHYWHKNYGFYAVAPFVAYGVYSAYRYNNCGWTWNQWGKQVYVCY
jgi:hypothetical protein